MFSAAGLARVRPAVCATRSLKEGLSFRFILRGWQGLRRRAQWPHQLSLDSGLALGAPMPRVVQPQGLVLRAGPRFAESAPGAQLRRPSESRVSLPTRCPI